LVIAPHFYSGWNRFEVERLHIGHDEVGYHYEQSGENTRIHVNDEGPEGLEIELVLPLKEFPHQVKVDGAVIAAGSWHMQDGHLHISLPGPGTRCASVHP